MPEVSVIVPTLNRPDVLRGTLESLARQSLEKTAFEVIVVIDGPDDATAEFLRTQAPLACEVVQHEAHRGPSVTRNVGAEAARGRYLLFLDDDITAEPGLVAAHLEAQRTGDMSVGIGPIRLSLAPRPDGFTRYFELTWSRRYEQFVDGSRVPTWRDCYSGNLALPKALFLEAGGFDAAIPRSHDVELGHRLALAGGTFVFVPQAESVERVPRSFRTTASHFERAGQDAWPLYQRHPELLAETELGFPWDPRPVSAYIFRLLLRIGAPVTLLATCDRLLGSKVRFRWHSLLARLFFWSGIRAQVNASQLRRLLYGTPILMYHAVGDGAERPSRFILPIRRFERQLRWLKRRGYRVISLDEYAAARARHETPEDKTVVITMDDGYEDNFELALPALVRHGMPATIFVVTQRAGGSNDWSPGHDVAGRRLASWDQLRSIRKGGLTLGGHTRTHPRLTDVDDERAQEEIGGAREDLTDHLQVSAATFAYPFGLQNERLAQLAAEAGYTASCSVLPGLNRARTPLHLLRRAEVRGTDSFFRFKLAVRFGDPDAFLSRKRR